MRAASIAATGMNAMQLNVEVISNNIANINTTAYKRNNAEFQSLMYQNLDTAAGTQTTSGGNIVPVGSSIGLGVKNTGIFTNNQQGPLQETESTFDVAIQGRGFFRLTDANGIEYYSRAGRFQPNADGLLVNPQGFEVDPAITIPDDASDITISLEGEVFATIDGQPTPTNLGRITLVTFQNEGGLNPEGNNLFTETESSGTPLDGNPGEVGYGTVQQGFIETSNVNAVIEITNLITAQRAYELNSRVVSTSDEMLQAVNNIK